jgi:SAM-dependent methyltransferase
MGTATSWSPRSRTHRVEPSQPAAAGLVLGYLLAQIDGTGDTAGVGATGGAEPGWLGTNRRLWDEMAAIHPSTELYDVEGLVAGRDDLRPWEDDELGPVDGLDLIHLQCHIGSDTIGWARRGARVVGLDFSPQALAAAGELSARCGLEIEWVQANVYDAVEAVGGRSFDVVYTGIGALGWLPDLRAWAQVVHDLLEPGGVLYLVELHPMWVALIEDGTTICQDAVGAAYTRWDEPDRASYADPGRRLSSVSSFERLHAVSELLSAVLDAGLTIELFHEFDVTPAPTPWLVPGEERLFRFTEGSHRFPLTYSLLARRVTPP